MGPVLEVKRGILDSENGISRFPDLGLCKGWTDSQLWVSVNVAVGMLLCYSSRDSRLLGALRSTLRDFSVLGSPAANRQDNQGSPLIAKPVSDILTTSKNEQGRACLFRNQHPPPKKKNTESSS